MPADKDITNRLERISSELETFLDLINSYPKTAVAGKRTILEELQHIVFWHNYYADNLEAFSQNNKQPLFKNYAEAEELTRQLTAGLSFNDLISLCNKSQTRIEAALQTAPDGQLKYKQGSRNYTPEEYLDTIADHLRSHNDFIKAKLAKSD